MRINEEIAINLLKKYSPNEEVFNIIFSHVSKVREIALRIAKSLNKKIDFHLISVGSLLHDIGRFFYPPGSKEKIKHGIKGAEIIRKELIKLDSDFAEKLALIAERHIGAGILKKDILKQKLPLPLNDFKPISIEEKIIAYADNLVFGNKEVSFEKVKTRFEKELGHEYVNRLIKLKEEIFN